MEKNWILADKKLPEPNTEVLTLSYPSSPTMDGKLVYGIDKRIDLAYAKQLPAQTRRRLVENLGFLNMVVYWQPLPERPNS